MDKDRVYDKDGRLVEVPEEGNLGLLAAGYKGIMVWRKKRIAMQNERLKHQQKQASQEQ